MDENHAFLCVSTYFAELLVAETLALSHLESPPRRNKPYRFVLAENGIFRHPQAASQAWISHSKSLKIALNTLRKALKGHYSH